MTFFLEMHKRYAPEMTPRAFSEYMNKLEVELFTHHPEYLELTEDEQNKHIEEFYRKKNVRH